jgi:uncharacterized membrane protein HdeD (DUF308 family)
MSANQWITNPLLSGINEIRRSWGWFLTLGISFILLGAVCIICCIPATHVTMLVFGWLLLFSGIVAMIEAFRVRSWNGFLLYLLSALLRGFTGYLLIRYPEGGAFGFTIVLASFFIVGGLFRAIGSSVLQFPRWGWAFFSGLVSFTLGILLLVMLPVSSVWFIGFALGVDMILDGTALIAFANAIHLLPGPHQVQATAA